jgi:phosphoenolpyruvate synthase/pyruvate phosphate dikinase
MLTDTQFLTNETYRRKKLQLLQELIIDKPVDTELIRMVDVFIRTHTDAKTIRFRSSTNVEDLPDFNGAGLYSSNTAVLDDPEKSIDMAIKRTWASLWLYDAFEERQYFKIDQHSIAMGILVHRSFKGDDAGDVDGVAITRDLYYPDLPAMTVNVQGYGVNVRNPPAGFMSDQFVFHTYTEDPYTNPSIEYLAHSNIMGGKPVLSNDQIISLVKYLEAIQRHFCSFSNPNCFIFYSLFAVDVEFKFEGNPSKLYFRQVRPYK